MDARHAIEWPIHAADAILSDKDRKHPTLGSLPAYFTYDEEDISGNRRLMTG